MGQSFHKLFYSNRRFKMRSRLVQLVARYVGMGMIMLAGLIGYEVDPQSVTEWAMPIATGLVGFLAMLGDLMFHKVETGSVLHRPGVKKVVPMILAVLLISVGGCAPSGAFVTASEKYHETVGEKWTDYIQQDESLTPIEKETRLEAHRNYGNAIEAEKRTVR